MHGYLKPSIKLTVIYVDKFKARLIIKGCSQKYGIDYHKIFSPMVRHESIRAIFAVAAVEKLKLQQFDIKLAFL